MYSFLSLARHAQLINLKIEPPTYISFIRASVNLKEPLPLVLMLPYVTNEVFNKLFKIKSGKLNFSFQVWYNWKKKQLRLKFTWSIKSSGLEEKLIPKQNHSSLAEKETLGSFLYKRLIDKWSVKFLNPKRWWLCRGG